jgi:hypothetical protein
MKDKDLRNLLLSQPLAGEHVAEERTWEVVRTAFLGREPVPRERHVPWKLLLVLAVIAAGVAVGVSSAGSSISDWVRDQLGRDRVVQGPPPPATPVLTGLPAAGRLLVTASGAVWVMTEDGARRRLGRFQGATWSPNGLFVAAWRGRELVALDPNVTDGVRWARPGRRILGARWSPSGVRVAYVSGGSLHVVVGDNSSDAEVAAQVAPVLPAWLPDAERNVLAYSDRDGRVLVVDTDADQRLWRTSRAPLPIQLAWTDDGERLAVLTEHQLRLFEEPRRLVAKLPVPEGLVATSMAARPGGQEIAYSAFDESTGKGSIDLVEGDQARLVFAGSGEFRDLAWSPDGELLLVGWEVADQWLFVPPESEEPVDAVGVARQFAPEGAATPEFPRVQGWCCPSSFQGS